MISTHSSSFENFRRSCKFSMRLAKKNIFKIFNYTDFISFSTNSRQYLAIRNSMLKRVAEGNWSGCG